jgi:hypothetical protein
MVWVRIGVACVALAIVLVVASRRNRRLRAATLDGSTLRRRVAETSAGFRRIEARLEELGFRMLGDYDLCDGGGGRLHRLLVAWNEAESTLALRGRKAFAFFTELDGHETVPTTIVVQTSVLDVDHTHPRYVVQTGRGVKDGNAPALLRIHGDAVSALGHEGWDQSRRQPDPMAFAHAVLVDAAAAVSIGTKRTDIALGRTARRIYTAGHAQVGSAIASVDPAELHDREGGDEST